MSKWVLGLAAAGLVLSVAWAQGGAQPPKPDILILDLQKVITSCDEHLDKVDALKKRVDEERAKLEGEVKQLQEAQTDVLKSEIGERDEEWYKKLRKMLDGQVKLKADETFFNVQTSDELARSLNALIRGAQMHARAIMRERGAQMVIVTKTGLIELNTEEEWKDELLRRRVLCATPEANISDEVRKRMDADYAKRKGR